MDRETTAGFSNSFDADGFIGGVHLGVNFQSGSFVYGIEADIEGGNVEGDDDGVGGAVDRFDLQWMGSVRGRLGYAWDRLLVYGTAGVAFADVEADADDFVASDSNTHTGWTVGAGAEFALNEQWTTRLEYRYADFSDERYELTPAYLDADYEFDMHAVRVGVSYKF